MYKLVAFDFDGTLADSADWFFEAMNELADEFGFKRVSSEERLYVRGLHSGEIMKHLGIPVWKLPRIVARMRQRSAADQHRFELFAGVPELFEALRARGLLIGIVSSNSEETIRGKLGQVCASHVIHYGCGSSLFGKGRKLKALLRATGAPAAETIYIGDEIRDAEAAREVGIAFGAVSWGYGTRESLLKLEPELIFETVDSIAVRLGRGLIPEEEMNK